MFCDAAQRIGVPIAIASDRCHMLEDPWHDGAIPVRFHQPEESAQKIVEFAREHPLGGIVAIGDVSTVTAAIACRELGLRFHPREAVEACRNKFLARERYLTAGMLAPWYMRYAADVDPSLLSGAPPFPCVLKPLGLSASRGVIRANNPQEFVAAFRRIHALLEQKDVRVLRDEATHWIQVESFIPGREVAVEGLMTRGMLRVLAIFDKPDPLDGPYFEETIYVTPSRLEGHAQKSIIECAEKAVAALGLWHGPVHLELRINERGAWMLDAAARPIGGLCARALRFEGGMPLEELIVRHALGGPAQDLPRESTASGVMMIPIPQAGVYEGVAGIEEAARTPGIEAIEITAKIRQKLVPLPEGSSYLGFIFARGQTPDEVERSLREAHGKLKFEISAELAVV